MKQMGRVWQWWLRRDVLHDVLIALLVWALLGAAPQSPDLRSGAGLVYAMVFCYGPIALRRQFTDIAIAVVVFGCLIQLWWFGAPLLQNFAVPILLFSAAAHGHPRLRWGWLGVAMLGSVLGPLDWYRGEFYGYDPRPITALGAAGLCLAAFGLGEATRSRHAKLESSRQRAVALESERESASALAIQAERSRIAREMHDVVAHSLSVIVVQADGAGYALERAASDVALGQARSSLTAIADTARTALTETRALVGVLRNPEEAAEYTPQATLVQLHELVAQARQSGVDVTLTAPTDLPETPVTTQTAIHRVAQEALTNAIRHAGPGATTRITLAEMGDELALAVRDDGVGSAPSDGNGHGIIGMRERITALGGTFTARPRAGRGFEVLATFPRR